MNDEKNNTSTFDSDVLHLKEIETLNRLTKYEQTRILSTRAAQIQNGMQYVYLENGKPVPIPDKYKKYIKNSIDCAKLELRLGNSPMIIRRTLPSGKSINKTVQEMV